MHDRGVLVEHAHRVHLAAIVGLEPDPEAGLDVVVQDIDVPIPVRVLVLMNQTYGMA